jgi:hypothetical protein
MNTSLRHTVTREDSQMTTSDELLVIETKDGIVGVQEFGVEDDLDSVGTSVKELYPSDLVQNGVGGVISHVVGDDWG